MLERLLEQRGTRLPNEEFDAALAYTAQRQNSTPQALRQELGESGLANYRFLLTRDKAVRETVQELLAAQGGSQFAAPEAQTETDDPNDPQNDSQLSNNSSDSSADPVESE